jgi:hypothetical protein
MNLVDPMFNKLMEREGCQWIGPDQDPRIHSPIIKCGCAVVPGKAYCEDHYRRMYIGGVPKKKKPVAKKQQTWAPGEMETLLWECYEELVESGEIEA